MSRWLEGIQAVVFDAVGTLIFPNPGAAVVYADAASRHGIPVNPSEIAPKLWSEFRLQDEADRDSHWVTSEQRELSRWEAIVHSVIPEATDQLFHELFQHFSQPTAWTVPPDTGHLLTELHSLGLTMGMASNYDSRLQQVVEGIHALKPVRDRLVISSLVGFRKPAPAFFTFGVLPAMGVARERILFVGDDPENDYWGAKASGMRAVLLDPDGRHLDVPERLRSLREIVEDGTPHPKKAGLAVG